MRPAARGLLGGRLRAAAFAARARAMVTPAAAAAATAPTPARLPIAPHADPLAAFPRRVAALPRRVSPACARHVGGIPLSPFAPRHPPARASRRRRLRRRRHLRRRPRVQRREHPQRTRARVRRRRHLPGQLPPRRRRARQPHPRGSARKSPTVCAPPDRARAAGQEQDAERLEARAADEGPYELLCVVRALLKKIKQRVLVVRPPLPSERRTGPAAESARRRDRSAPRSRPESTPRIGAPSSRSFLAFLPHFIT